MTRDEMVAAVRSALGEHIDVGTPEARILQALNSTHRFRVPDEVAGELRYQNVTFSTVQGTDTYDLEALYTAGSLSDSVLFKSVLSQVAITGQTLRLANYERATEFWSDNDPGTTQSKPQAVLIEGQILFFRPVPDAAYTIFVPGYVYPDDLGASGDVTPYAPRAWADVYGAAVELAAGDELDHVANYFDALYERERRKVSGRSASQSKGPRRRSTI